MLDSRVAVFHLDTSATLLKMKIPLPWHLDVCVRGELRVS